MTAAWRGAFREHEARLASERAEKELTESFGELVRLDKRDASESLRLTITRRLSGLRSGDWRAATHILLSVCDDMRALAHEDMTPEAREMVDAMMARISGDLAAAAMEDKAA